MNEQKPVEPPKEPPKHYGIVLEPGQYVIKLGQPAAPKPEVEKAK